MFFNSIDFLFFLPIVFVIYWISGRVSLRLQNTILLVASYFFYACWDWRFLSLIIVSSLCDFGVGLILEREDRGKYRKAYLSISIFINLGILLFFKYFNFFYDSFLVFTSSMGLTLHPTTLKIILPVGISFYTFQTMSYTIDVYRKRCQPTKDPLAFFTYVAFFPQLVAGPIERANRFLPQFSQKRIFSYVEAQDGVKRILWGLVKKVVIADNLAVLVDYTFENHNDMSGIAIALGLIYFSLQIYCDFSGYSGIAIGVSKLFGFQLMCNFDRPYFSTSFQEFWRKWHISLSTWFRDYLFFPLGGSKVNSNWKYIRNIVIVFGISGFWHGASWNFLIWGILHAFFYVGEYYLEYNKKIRLLMSKFDFSRNEALVAGIRMCFVFSLVTFAWIFFRAQTLGDACEIIKNLFMNDWFVFPELKSGLPYAVGIVIWEWCQREKEHSIYIYPNSILGRWSIYYILILIIFIFRPSETTSFIYFQF